MTKRYRHQKSKPGELRVYFGLPEGDTTPDIVYSWGGAGAGKPDGSMLCHFLQGMTYFEGRNLVQELRHRGYDITTLRFSVQQAKRTSPSEEAAP